LRRQHTPTPSLDLEATWQAPEAVEKAKVPRKIDAIPEQYLLLLTCRHKLHMFELI